MKTENIKFKAKELGTGKWKEGFLQRDMDYNLCILIAKKEEHSWYWTQIDPSTVCMFTGLTDCKGNEIFEHDLIHFVGFSYTAEVIWSEGNYAFMVVCENKHSYWLHDVIDLCRIERIDNKFDKEK